MIFKNKNELIEHSEEIEIKIKQTQATKLKTQQPSFTF